MIVDSHCHLQDPEFGDARNAVTRAVEHDVWGIIAVGCDPASNSGRWRSPPHNGKIVWPAFGFHPEWPLTDEDLDRVEDQVTEEHARLVALGEIGLPWYSLDGAADPRGDDDVRARALRAIARSGRALRPAGGDPRSPCRRQATRSRC